MLGSASRLGKHRAADYLLPCGIFTPPTGSPQGFLKDCRKNQIPREKLKEFKDLYKKHYGIDLTDQEALEKGTKLLNFVRIISQVDPKE
jgi:hypothetical protein